MVPSRSSMLKNKQTFSIVILKLIPAFSTAQFDVAKNYINEYAKDKFEKSKRRH